MQSQPSFFTFWKTLFLRPKTFFQQYFMEEGRPPFWGWAVAMDSLLVLAVTIISQISQGQERYEQVSMPVLVVLICLVLPLVLIVYYYFLGWIEKLFILLAGGKISVKKARYVVLYRGVATQVMAIVPYSMLAFFRIHLDTPLQTWLLGLLVLTLPIMFYGAYLRYCSARVVGHTKKGWTIFWTFFFPLFLTTAALVMIGLLAGVVGLVTYLVSLF